MATSGTVSTTVFNTRRVIDHAFRRCRVPPQQITAEMHDYARDQLHLLLSSVSNRKLPLWTIEKQILPLYQGQAAVTTPVGTMDILEANRRTLARASGTNVSSAGGTVANAFDDDFATALTQTSTNGNVRTQFTTATLITSVGILPNATATWNLIFERSTDAVTWTTVLDPASAAYVAGTWVWYDLDGNIADIYFRVRETGGGTLDLREVYLGNNPNEISLYRMNRDEYVTLPDKFSLGQVNQFWLDRQDIQPVMYTWPVTGLGNRYDQIVAWRKRHIEDVGTLQQDIEVPQRGYDAIVYKLAHAVGIETPEVPIEWVAYLDQQAEIKMREFEDEERDNSTQRVVPAIGVYTR